MDQFNLNSIRLRILGVVTLVTMIGISTGLGLTMYHSIGLIKERVDSERNIIANMTADSSASPLAFSDHEGAIEVLARLSKNKDIHGVLLFDNDNQFFAGYIRDNNGQWIIATPEYFKKNNRRHSTLSKLRVDIKHNNTKYGELCILHSNTTLSILVDQYQVTVVYILIFAFALSFVIAIKFEKIISNPILRLSETTKTIRTNNDYSIRVYKKSSDEIGELYDSFNLLLEQIEHRENELNKTVENLDVAVNSLTESNQQLESFAYICSHDLQEPVRMVNSFSQLLVDHLGDELDEKAKRYLKFIIEGADNAHIIITDVLQFCRFDKNEDRKEKVDLNSVFDEVYRDMSDKIETHNYKLVRLNDLPIVHAMRSQIYQLFINLVSNGFKFNQSEQPKVTFKCSEMEGSYEIRIQDNGIGINEHSHAKIFEMFSRLQSKHEYPGTGLGLAICKKIVESNGGEISLESETNQGTCFIIRWPILNAEDTNETAMN